MAVVVLEHDAEARGAVSFEPAAAVVLDLPRPLPSALGVGAYLKTSIAAVSGQRAVLSPVVGNLDVPEARLAHEAMAEAYAAAFTPAAVGHDLHPDFPSSQTARGLGRPTLGVQHHHAHVLATAAENRCLDPVLGLALDGFGLGTGGESWGGECLFVDGARFQRVGSLRPLPQPGGDAAALAPWRMAAGVLYALGCGAEIATRFADQVHAGNLHRLLERGINCPPTSSAGRLFDAAAALSGLHPTVTFEGEAPIALEKLVDAPTVVGGGWHLDAGGRLDMLPVMTTLSPADPVGSANRFHGTLIDGLTALVEGRIAELPTRTVVLTGGCFFNAVLRDGLTARLEAAGLTVLRAGAASPGDPSVALGQALAAALQLETQEG